jgi:hypothetical protein
MPAAADAGVAAVETVVLDFGNPGAVDSNDNLVAQEGELQVMPGVG